MACEGCLEKLRKIDDLQEEVKRLRGKLNYEQKKTKDGFFGSSTSSAKKPVKENTSCDCEDKKGGAKNGHIGHGRKSIAHKDADRVEILDPYEFCPDCGERLSEHNFRERSVIDSPEIKTEKVIYKYRRGWCNKCMKSITPKMDVLSKSLYSNQLAANVLLLHYEYQVPLGRIESMFGGVITKNNIIDISHRIAESMEPAMPVLIRQYRNEFVKHADETSWRTDGANGYAWIFCGGKTIILKFTNTRSALIPQGILGNEQLNGFLVVDRYAAYNKSPCDIQYCFSHLARKTDDLLKMFPDEIEVQNFVLCFSKALCDAITLRSLDISDDEYYLRANRIKKEIITLANSPSKHLGIKEIQSIFLENDRRLYHWADHRIVPADNNYAERELRSTVIARKVSFGSQSTDGCLTRSILMSILKTMKKRLNDKSLFLWLKLILDSISSKSSLDFNFTFS